MLDVPESYDSTGPAMPLVLNFHGSGGCPDDYRGLNPTLEPLRTHFLLVYPQGVFDAEGFQSGDL